MRKLFAMVATVAIVLSMFSGIAFAAAADYNTSVDKVILNTSSATLTGNMQSLIINGQLVDSSGKLVSGDVKVSVKKNGTEVGPIEAKNGVFSYSEIIPAGSTAANYVFSVRIHATETDKVKTATFALKYNVTLTSPGDLNFTLQDVEGRQQAIIGAVKYSDGTAYKPSDVVEDGVALYWLDANGAADVLIVEDDLLKSGQFGFFADLTKAGDIGLFVEGVKHLTGKVTALGMSISATPSTGIVHTVADTTIKFEMTGGPEGKEDKAVVVVVKKGGTTLTDAQYKDLGFASNSLADRTRTVAFENGKGTFNVVSDFSEGKGGTYTFEVTVAGTHKASTNISVINPSSYSLVDPSGLLEEQPIDDHDIKIGQAADAIKVIKYPGGLDTDNYRYVLYVDGSSELDFVTSDDANKTHTISPTGGTTKSIRIVAYTQTDGGTWTNKVFDKTYTVKYTGWVVTYDVKTVIMRQETEITFEVKDVDGNPINNAWITIIDDEGKEAVFVDPTTKNISNGVYTGKVRFSTNAGAFYVRQIEVHKGSKAGDSMATIVNGLTVIGNPVYDVTANMDTLLNGKKHTIQMTAYNGSETFIPTSVYQQVGSAQPTALGITPKADGTFEVSVTPTDATKDITLRVESADGTKTGSVVLKVVKPLLVIEENEAITENYNSFVKFQVIDPRNGDILEKDLTISYGDYIKPAKATVLDSTKNVASNDALIGSSMHEVYFRVTDVDWTTAKEDEKNVTVGFSIKLDHSTAVSVDGKIAVKEATLTSNPETVILGQANNLVLTLTDANGNGIAGKKIHLGDDNKGAVIGTTDDKGQVVYATSAAVNLAAVTDESGEYVTKQVVAGVDTAAPVITAPETTDKNTAVITITDNVRIVRVMINGVEDTTFFPGPTYTKTVDLKVGANNFTVQAMDNNYNTVNQTITINYVPATGNQVVLQGTQVVRQGENLLLQIRQFEELGATLNWNDATKTATFTVGDKTVEVTVGSKTAKVNGVAVTMVVAPINVDGRVLVHSRFVAEALGWTVNWAAGDIITIIK